MTQKTSQHNITIDATGKTLGRLASDIAIHLQGKRQPGYAPHRDQPVQVVIQNASHVKITGKKLQQKVYRHASGYPGGLKETPMRRIWERNPKEVIRRAVWNMLPKNTLRSKRIKRLNFT